MPRKSKNSASEAVMAEIRALNEARPGSRSYKRAQKAADKEAAQKAREEAKRAREEAKRASEEAKAERKKTLPKGGHPYDEAVRRLVIAHQHKGKSGIFLSTQKAKLLRKLRNPMYKLPQDSPHREELGLTIDPFKAIRAIEKDMTRMDHRDYGPMVRRVKEWEEQIKQMEQEDT